MDLREFAPATDGSKHRHVSDLANEIGVGTIEIIANSQVIGSAQLNPDGPGANLHVTTRLSLLSGGLVYQPDSLEVFSQRNPEDSYRIILA